MRSLATILFFVLLLSQTFGKMWIYVSFKWHQEEIAKTLCVQKEVENNTCQGSCHLKKELNKADREEQQPSKSVKEKAEILYCQYGRDTYAFFNTPRNSSQSVVMPNDDSYHSSFLADIFQPPRVAYIG